MRQRRLGELGLLASFLVGLSQQELTGQTLVKDSATGNYLLSYTALDGLSYSVILPSNDRIDPLIELHSVQGSGTGTRIYGYRVINRATPGSVTPIESFSIRCPSNLPQLRARSTSSGSSGRVDTTPWDGVVCDFLLGRDSALMVLPGSQKSNIEIRAEGLPAVIEAKAFGYADIGPLPSQPDETPDTVFSLLERAQGIGFAHGGGKATHSVGPWRPYSSAADVGTALSLVRDDVATVCGSLGWITMDSTCTRLQGYLTTDLVDVRGFLDYLTAHHPDGKAVDSNNAYFLLKTIAEYARSRVTSANLQLVYVCGNRFKVRNYNTVGLPVRYEVVTPGEFGDVSAAAKPAGSPYSETEFTVTTPGRTRLYYDGLAIHYPLWEFQNCP